VRGLDYYSGLVFEWTTDKLGAQSAICAGGRYDTLVENLGGQKTPAIGFGIGMERLLLLLEELGKLPINTSKADVFFVLDNTFVHQSMAIVDGIRDEFKNLTIDMDLKVGSIKSQFKKADKSGAKIAIVIGKEELLNKVATIMDLKKNEPIQLVAFDDLLNFLEGEM
jgi:histidyl-tRNA synthetase